MPRTLRSLRTNKRNIPTKDKNTAEEVLSSDSSSDVLSSPAHLDDDDKSDDDYSLKIKKPKASRAKASSKTTLVGRASKALTTPKASTAADSAAVAVPTKAVASKTTGTTTPVVTLSNPAIISQEEEVNDDFTITLPTSWLTTGQPPPGDCNLLIQLDPEDAQRLDYDGVSGAIGRFEAGANGIVLDLKGRQYQGSILPGPTAMTATLAKGRQLRVDGITDEFATMVQTSDVMAKLDAIVTGAELDDGYRYVEENVNRVDRNKSVVATAAAIEAVTPGKSKKRESIAKPRSSTKRRKKSSVN